MKQYHNIESALRSGHNLRAFRSGGGLRVVRIEDLDAKLRGYGEHPYIETALQYADDDYIADTRPYHEVYGGTEDHYLTGSGESSSLLDDWVLRGQTFDAMFQDNSFVFILYGFEKDKFPEEAWSTIKTGGTYQWEKRGYLLEASPSVFPNGDIGARIDCIRLAKVENDTIVCIVCLKMAKEAV